MYPIGRALGLIAAAGLVGVGALMCLSCNGKEDSAPSNDADPRGKMSESWLLFLEFEQNSGDPEGPTLRIIDASRRKVRPIRPDRIEARANALDAYITDPDSGLWLAKYVLFKEGRLDDDENRLEEGYFLAGNRVSVEVLLPRGDPNSIHTAGRVNKTTLRIPIPYFEHAKKVVLEHCFKRPSECELNPGACCREIFCYSLEEKNECRD